MTLIDVLDFLEEKVDCPNWQENDRIPQKRVSRCTPRTGLRLCCLLAG